MGDDTSRVVRPPGRGRITIPIAMRRALGIDESSLLQLSLENGRVVITKLIPTAIEPVRVYTDEELARFWEEDRVPPETARLARSE